MKFISSILNSALGTRHSALPLRLITLIGVIVPQRLRVSWRQEWEAELRYREMLLAEWESLNWRNKLELFWHSLGAFWDALWLQTYRWEDEMIQDLRYGVRMLLKNPGFTAVAVLTLVLGIGANTAIFSVVNTVLLRPLPFGEPDRIVRLWESNSPNNLAYFSVSSGAFLDWRSQNQVFSEMAGYREDGFNLFAESEAKRVSGARVTSDFFSVLGIRPALGRAFLPAEAAPGGERVVVLSYGLWQRSFGGDPQLVGRQVRIDGQSYTVIGVMPSGFQYPFEDTGLWLPFAFSPAQVNRVSHFLRVIGRLKPGVTLPQARAEMESIAVRMEQTYPDTNKNWRVAMLSLHDSISSQIKTTLYVLLGAVGFVLLIACANVANLLLSRNASREREIAIRAALGAGRGRIIRQLLTESLLLAIAGGAGAIFVAFWGIKALVAFGPRNLPRLNEVSLDGSVLGFTLLVSVVTGVIFGLAPALQRSKLDLNNSLKDGGRTAGGSSRKLRNLLVVSEVAFALLLLVCAGLMLKSFVRLQQVSPGFEPEQSLTMEINLALAKYAKPNDRASFLQQTLDRIKTVPGVTYAGAAHRLPLLGNSFMGFNIDGRPPAAPNETPSSNYRSIAPDYFRAIGSAIVAGRTFTEEEAWQKGGVVIINQTLQRKYWPNEDPVGKRIKQLGPNGEVMTIVGVAADMKESGLDSETENAIYMPYVAGPIAKMVLVMRTSIEPLSLAAAVSAEIQQVDREQAVSNISTLGRLLNETVAQPRFNAFLLALFALLALLLAAVGIYGVIAYSVTQRRRELGIRMALGAGRKEVLRLVVGQGMKLTGLGLAFGLLASLGVTQLLKTLLFGVSVTDPLTYTLIAGLLASVALLACYLPARRAAKVDPLIALRDE